MFVMGVIADRYGRKKAYYFNLFLILIFSVATVFAPNFEWFCVFRFFVGTGSGWAYVLPVSRTLQRASLYKQGRFVASPTFLRSILFSKQSGVLYSTVNAVGLNIACSEQGFWYRRTP